jgi:peptidoglycan hydrolase-like protein with peptidoglycan-binding domain
VDEKKKKGFLSLAKKSLSVIAASLAALTHNEGQAKANLPATDESNANNINVESFNKRMLRPKLVLKLNISSPENSIIAMHTSHSSHSSHSSHMSSSTSGHYSHSSHSSHYSSSPSYTPSTSYTPSRSYTPPAKTYSSPSYKSPSTYKAPTIKYRTNIYRDPATADTTLRRELYRGCTGTDVKEMQLFLGAKGYRTLENGIFDLQTELKVKRFQAAHGLVVDGTVGKLTFDALYK